MSLEGEEKEYIAEKNIWINIDWTFPKFYERCKPRFKNFINPKYNKPKRIYITSVVMKVLDMGNKEKNFYKAARKKCHWLFKNNVWKLVNFSSEIENRISKRKKFKVLNE